MVSNGLIPSASKMDWKEGGDRDREGGERIHTGRQAGRKRRRKDAKRKYAGMERDEQGRGEGGGGGSEKDEMHASRQEGIKGRKEARGNLPKNLK